MLNHLPPTLTGAVQGSDFWNSLWPWPGWAAVAAAGTVVAAFGTLFSFIVIWRQLILSQSETVESKHAAITPFFSIDFHDMKPSNSQQRILAKLDLNPILNGVANAIGIDIDSADATALDFKPEPQRIASLVASSHCSVNASWRDPTAGDELRATLVIRFTNALGRQYEWRQGLTFKHGGVAASDPPVQKPISVQRGRIDGSS